MFYRQHALGASCLFCSYLPMNLVNLSACCSVSWVKNMEQVKVKPYILPKNEAVIGHVYIIFIADLEEGMQANRFYPVWANRFYAVRANRFNYFTLELMLWFSGTFGPWEDAPLAQVSGLSSPALCLQHWQPEKLLRLNMQAWTMSGPLSTCFLASKLLY